MTGISRVKVSLILTFKSVESSKVSSFPLEFA